MSRRILYIITLLWLGLATAMAADKKFTLVIDAGHGGKDGGACANGAKEKNINLSVALAFGKYVEQNCSDVKVLYTRKTDVFVPLHGRADFANKNKADIFISIHTNSVERGTTIRGLETYTMGMRRSDEKRSAAMRENEVILIENDYKQHYDGFDPKSPESYIIFDMINESNMAESVELAQLIQKNVCATAGRPNKGVKQDAFLVLRETSMPACLIELGYITTPAEATYLTNRTNVDAMARGIYQAFVAYKNKRTQTASPTQPAQPTQPTQPTQPVENAQPQQQTQTQQQTQPEQQTQTEQPANQQPVNQQPAAEEDDSQPVFKVQILASDKQLATNDRQLKGLSGVDCYKEGRLWKYTVGASTNYQEIYQLRKDVLNKFPQAFIIAFKNGERVDAAEALKEYRRNNN